MVGLKGKVVRVPEDNSEKNKVTLPVVHPSVQPFPPPLWRLFEGEDPASRNFQTFTRMYNNSISFTSLGADVNNRKMVVKLDIPKFTLSGTVATRKFKHESEKLKNAGQVLEAYGTKTYKLQGVPLPRSDPKRYNEPTVEEVAVIVQGEGDIVNEHQILLHRADGGLKYISDMHSSYFPLRYPLFFPRGEQQWDNLYTSSTGRVASRKVGSLEWFAFLLFQRPLHFSAILSGRSLLQEFLVDMYVCVERSRLQYIRGNQDKLQAGKYNQLVAALENGTAPKGQPVILPSSFIGSPRNMQQLYQDTMSLCRKHGPPSLFITMTANPNWPEILNYIPKNDETIDHPTLVVRVFYQKVLALIDEIVVMRRFGQCVSFVYTIEFQKQGLPHLHLMVTLAEADRPVTPEQIDLIVCAELPCPVSEPILHKLVTQFMLHGPCKGRACWNAHSCKFGYPKPFSERTVTVDGAYPVYRRRDTGVKVKKHTLVFDDGSVVPYNKFLTSMFEYHINVEVPVKTTAVKYLYKYITKGHDRAYMAIAEVDEAEAQSFIDARYISAPEVPSLEQDAVGNAATNSRAWRALSLL
ncbi:hypothetical protein MJO28_010661 [Puccinia striiformis f. sp. tritici]|uniref:Uncharacterized protein n=1 Tax=Puccinia striiformis f. sp. tritici TaxID=168172 RepID=A0ACC0E5N5_9BASI|nr:hypothetical protein MJO28_010661 [Puccinia striiformis f. sp. tritici]